MFVECIWNEMGSTQFPFIERAELLTVYSLSESWNIHSKKLYQQIVGMVESDK